MRTGSLAWGIIQLGIPWTLGLAVAGLTLPWRLPQDVVDCTPSPDPRPDPGLNPGPDPVVVGEIADDRGPVVVTVEYRVGPAKSAAFGDVSGADRSGPQPRRCAVLGALH
jgi:hypothetical protein